MNEVVKQKSMTGAWIALIASLVYVFSPIDLIPDVLPVAGWLDDLLIGITGVLHFFQMQAESANSSFAVIAKTLKWGIIILGGIAVLLLLLFGALIVGLFVK